MAEELAARLLAEMEWHRGYPRRIGMAELWRKVYHLPCHHRINDTSPLRVLIRKLRRQGHPICSTCDKYDPGYWMAETPEELAEFAARHQRRGLTSLSQAASIMRITMPELLGQLKLEEEQRA
jgi:hypothetical protein